MQHSIIPAAALEQHIAVLGKNGSGKTYATKATIVEPLLAAGKHVAVVDPTSAWWGLRSSADGKGPGFKIIVLGGDHGDLPLPVNSGAAVARLIIVQRVNAVIDTGNLTVGERTRWMVDFAGALYRLNRTPLHLVLDEAHVFAPQGKVPDPDTGKMLHAVNQLASGGRSRGIRLTMLTQRPQKLHKDALTTADTLIAMRVLAPHDREAVKAWIDGCGDLAQGRQVLDSLAQLQRGEGWVWYPEGGHLLRAKFPAIRTFDSSATPTDGHALTAPKAAAEVDLTEISAALADAVAEAEANDPKRLRARIAELEREGKKPRELAVDVDALAKARRDGYAMALQAVQPIADRLNTLSLAITESIEGFDADLKRLAGQAAPAVPLSPRVPAAFQLPHAAPAPRPAPAPQRAPAGRGSIDKPMPRAFLTALAQHPDGLTKGQILVHTGYRSSGPVSTCFAELARNGWIDTSASRVRITDAGLKALGDYDPLPTGKALRDWLLAGDKVSGMEKKILEVIFYHYPQAVAKGEILQVAGYASSGPTSQAFARLVALGYAVQADRGHLRAARELFE